MEQKKLDELFKLFSKVKLAQQAHFSSEMAYENTIQERENEEDKDNDNDDHHLGDNNCDDNAIDGDVEVN